MIPCPCCTATGCSPATRFWAAAPRWCPSRTGRWGTTWTLAPAHGEQRDDVAEVLAHYRSHRQERIAQVQEVLASGKSTAEEVADVVYADVPASVRPAALSIVRAQLAYIESLGS